jgi:hypothetical protein
MDKERITYLRIQHNHPNNWYSRVCEKCKKKYNINRITKPEIDEELNYCFECYQYVIYDDTDKAKYIK